MKMDYTNDVIMYIAYIMYVMVTRTKIWMKLQQGGCAKINVTRKYYFEGCAKIWGAKICGSENIRDAKIKGIKVFNFVLSLIPIGIEGSLTKIIQKSLTNPKSINKSLNNH